MIPISIERFTIPFSLSAVEDLRSRLKQTRWPDAISNPSWSYGTDLEFLIDLCTYWGDRFDWKAQVDRMAAFEHYRYQAPEGKVHFLHAQGKGPDPMPLILTHGWPDSFTEMLAIVPMLTDPVAYGWRIAMSRLGQMTGATFCSPTPELN